MTISSGMIGQFREEVDQLLSNYCERRVPQLKREHQVTATPEIASPIIDGLLKTDSIYSKLKQILELCDDSLIVDQPIKCIGD